MRALILSVSKGFAEPFAPLALRIGIVFISADGMSGPFRVLPCHCRTSAFTGSCAPRASRFCKSGVSHGPQGRWRVAERPGSGIVCTLFPASATKSGLHMCALVARIRCLLANRQIGRLRHKKHKAVGDQDMLSDTKFQFSLARPCGFPIRNSQISTLGEPGNWCRRSNCLGNSQATGPASEYNYSGEWCHRHPPKG